MENDQYGLIGYPLIHSFSMNFFNKKFSSENIRAEYFNFEISSISELETVLQNNPHLKGLNVTIPYKEQIVPYMDKLDEDAKKIGAVNVVRIEKKKGKPFLVGFNSDIIGFKNSIISELKFYHQKALVLGTGGAAKAVFCGLNQLGLIPTYVSRQKKSDYTINYDDLTCEIINSHTVIVNCTPVGMYPNTDKYPKIPYEFLSEKHLLYDLLYNPDETLFMKFGKRWNAKVCNGLEMLLLQASASWNFWLGVS